MFIYIYICICKYIYIYIYIHTHTHTTAHAQRIKAYYHDLCVEICFIPVALCVPSHAHLISWNLQLQSSSLSLRIRVHCEARNVTKLYLKFQLLLPQRIETASPLQNQSVHVVQNKGCCMV